MTAAVRPFAGAARYRALATRLVVLIGLVVAALPASAGFDMALGPADYRLSQVIDALLSAEGVDVQQRVVVWSIRIPIALLAVFTGAALAIMVGIGVPGALVWAMPLKAFLMALEAVLFWTMGSLTQAIWPKVAIIALMLPLMMRQAWALTTLRLGDDKAVAMGIDVRRLRLLVMLLVTLLAAVPVAFVGSIRLSGWSARTSRACWWARISVSFARIRAGGGGDAVGHFGAFEDAHPRRDPARGHSRLHSPDLQQPLPRMVTRSLHDLNQALRYCAQTLVIAQGRLRAAGPTVEVVTAAPRRTKLDLQPGTAAHRHHGQTGDEQGDHWSEALPPVVSMGNMSSP